MTTQKTPRKHASLIKAWADDDSMEIEVLMDTGRYRTCQLPSWYDNAEYRQKPPPKVQKWQWAYKEECNSYTYLTHGKYASSEEVAASLYNECRDIVIEWMQKLDNTVVEE